jgi:small subunit ribosomal protein S18
MAEEEKAGAETEEKNDQAEEKEKNESLESSDVKETEEVKPAVRTGPRITSDNNLRQKRTYFRKKVCKLCVRKAQSVDYKDVDLLRKFVTDRGKILPRRITGTCAKHQRMLSKAIMRARMIALLPFVSK